MLEAFMRARVVLLACLVLIASGAALTAVLTRAAWLPLLSGRKPDEPSNETHTHDEPKRERVTLTPQAVASLRLRTAPLQLDRYRRTIQVPGIVVDRHGLSDRGVPAPVAGVVTEVHVQQGVAVAPGAAL